MITIASSPISDTPLGSGTVVGLLTSKFGPKYPSCEKASAFVVGRVRLSALV